MKSYFTTNCIGYLRTRNEFNGDIGRLGRLTVTWMQRMGGIDSGGRTIANGAEETKAWNGGSS